MKRILVFSLIAGSIASVAVGASVSLGASEDTGCWDEYNVRGTRMYRVVAPKDVNPNDCTSGEGCYFSYRSSDGKKVRWMVPHDMKPSEACIDIPVTTLPPATTAPATTAPATTAPATTAPATTAPATTAPATTAPATTAPATTAPATTAPATTAPPTTAPPTPTGRFETLPVGASLPSDGECAAAIRSMTENRPGNVDENETEGTGPNGRYPRVTGAFTGTTDEIIQWTACKWGIDEDVVRAQIVTESNWKQDALGDFTSNSAVCLPGHPIASYPPQYDGDSQHVNECPESGGLGQVRWQYHQEAFENLNAIRSSAYNLDYTYAVWRSCFEGEMTWLNTVQGRGDYAAGDLDGCLGVWFSGRWHTQTADSYIGYVNQNLSNRVWQDAAFPPAMSDDGTTPTTTSPTTTTTLPPTTTTTTTKPTTTTTTTLPPTTTTTTAAPTTTTTTTTTTTAPPTTPPTTPPASGAFVETFDTQASLSNWTATVSNGQNFFERPTSWQGDHDMSCGSPATSRTIHWPDTNDNLPDVRPAGETMWWCSPGNPNNGHVMTAFQTKGYAHLDFTPNRTFEGVSNVCWDMNATNLGNRKWVQLAVVPASVAASVAPRLDWTHPGFRASDGPASWGLDLSGGVFLYSSTQGNAETFTDGLSTGISFDNDTSSADKSQRYTTCVRDNRDNTVTISQGRPDGSTSVNRLPGRFPSGEVKVVFQDVSYDPDKAESPPMVNGKSWHWDNIIIE